MAMAIEPRPAVRRMAPYKPPAEGRAGKLRLDFNENTAGASPRVAEALRSAVSAENLTMYPEYAEARPRLARHFGVSPDQLLLTNGTDEAIQVMVNTFIEPGDRAVVLEPTYAMYRFYAEVMGANVLAVPYRPETLEFPLDELCRVQAKAIFVSNPNNPTGSWLERDAIAALLEAHPDTAILIDEAYFDFSGITVLDWIGRYPNLFVSRTFSKVYGLAAMRMGCLMSAEDNVAWMRKAQSPYSVNALAAVAALAAVEDVEFIRDYARQAVEARETIAARLQQLGIRCYPSRGNFILFDAGSRALEIRDTLRDRGVLVRDRSYEIAGCVRVTAGTREHARRFLSELEKIW
jgi:histidinol-phosphate aminotransferase